MKKKYLLLFVSWQIFLPIMFIAQENKKIDSLLMILKTKNDDTTKVNLLNSLSSESLRNNNIDAAKKYAEDALSLAVKKEFKNGIVNAYIGFGNISIRLGNNYYNQENYPDALKNYLAALKIFEKNAAKKEMAKTRRNIGMVHWYLGNYSEALKNHLVSLDLNEEIDDKKAIATAYNDIGNIYETQRNFNDALKNYSSALKIDEETGNKRAMINRLFNIGFVYDNQGNYFGAIKNFTAALKISEEIGIKDGIAACNINIADTYFHQGVTESDPEKRKKLFSEALNNYMLASKVYQESNDRQGLAICYNGIGGVFLESKNFPKARQFLNDGLLLFKEMRSIEFTDPSYPTPSSYIRDNYQLLAKLDSATGDWKKALDHYKLYILYRDSLVNSMVNKETTQKITRTQMQFEFDKKEDSLKYQQTLTDEKLKQQTLLTHQQTLIKNYLIAGFVLFALLSFFVYRNYRTSQQLKLQTLRNKIASDLHDDIGSTLSSISIFSQMAQQESKEVIPLLETIGENSRKMLDAMADIVWTINPENDQFEKIILRMRSFAYELLGAKKIDFEFLADEEVTKMKLSMDVRKNLYLIFKEAINNMVKYSGADKALFNIKGEKNNLIMLIHDNGKGFDTRQSTTGNGLKNMKKRAEEIGAQFMIDSKPGAGTTIELKIAV